MSTFKNIPVRGSRTWADPVATTLPAAGGSIGECRLVISSRTIYEWNGFNWQAILQAGDNLAGSVASLNETYVTFSNGGSLETDFSNFYWDYTNKRLGIGTASPAAKVHVAGDAAFNGNIGYFGNDPVAPYAPYVGSFGFVANGGSFAYGESTWTGDIPGYNYTMGDVVCCLKLLGILAM